MSEHSAREASGPAGASGYVIKDVRGNDIVNAAHSASTTATG